MIGSQTSLRVVVIAHFILTIWASMTPQFLPVAYVYMNLFILGFGAYAIINQDNVESIFMYLLLHGISFIQDCIFVGLATPDAKHIYESPDSFYWNSRNEYRFSLGMSIVNLLIKPFTTFVVYRIYKDRGGQYGDFNIPGIPGFTGNPGPYENIDTPAPSHGGIETASPHSYDKPPYEP